MRTTAARRSRRRKTEAYALVAAPKPWLNRRKNQPSSRSKPRVSKSLFAPFGLSTNTDRAGLKVRELKAEIIVATAIVSAN